MDRCAHCCWLARSRPRHTALPVHGGDLDRQPFVCTCDSCVNSCAPSWMRSLEVWNPNLVFHRTCTTNMHRRIEVHKQLEQWMLSVRQHMGTDDSCVWYRAICGSLSPKSLHLPIRPPPCQTISDTDNLIRDASRSMHMYSPDSEICAPRCANCYYPAWGLGCSPFEWPRCLSCLLRVVLWGWGGGGGDGVAVDSNDWAGGGAAPHIDTSASFTVCRHEVHVAISQTQYMLYWGETGVDAAADWRPRPQAAARKHVVARRCPVVQMTLTCSARSQPAVVHVPIPLAATASSRLR